MYECIPDRFQNDVVYWGVRGGSKRKKTYLFVLLFFLFFFFSFFVVRKHIILTMILPTECPSSAASGLSKIAHTPARCKYTTAQDPARGSWCLQAHRDSSFMRGLQRNVDKSGGAPTSAFAHPSPPNGSSEDRRLGVVSFSSLVNFSISCYFVLVCFLFGFPPAAEMIDALWTLFSLPDSNCGVAVFSLAYHNR